MLIKICGLTRPQDIAAVNKAMPDFIGFVFAESRRRVTPAAAARLREGLDGRIGAVGVFVDENPGAVAETARRCGLCAVQLHGGEDERYIAALKPLLPAGCAVWKAVRVRAAADILAAGRLPADRLLLDAYAPGKNGGTGLAFDWELLGGLRVGIPFFLAGGIGEGNVERAVRLRGPDGIDVSSGAETDGVKDPEKIRRLVLATKNPV